MRRSRRSFLASATRGTAAVAGGVALAGCSALPGQGRLDDREGADGPVRVLAAGSLQRALERGLRDAVDGPIQIEAHGSATAARLVADGQRDPDVLALADTALFSRLLDDAWYASFATNALAVATADTDGGRAVRAAATASDRRWYDPIVDGDAELGRTDPALDPLGYRTRFLLDLTAARDDRPGLPDAVLAPDQVYPETALLSQFETGAIDAAVVYASMATDRGYHAVDLPASVDLSDPAHADAYATATYDLPDGGRIHGDVIEYGATLRSPDDPAAKRVFDALVDGTTIARHGFPVPDGYPAYSENAPAALAEA